MNKAPVKTVYCQRYQLYQTALISYTVKEPDYQFEFMYLNSYVKYELLSGHSKIVSGKYEIGYELWVFSDGLVHASTRRADTKNSSSVSFQSFRI